MVFISKKEKKTRRKMKSSYRCGIMTSQGFHSDSWLLPFNARCSLDSQTLAAPFAPLIGHMYSWLIISPCGAWSKIC